MFRRFVASATQDGALVSRTTRKRVQLQELLLQDALAERQRQFKDVFTFLRLVVRSVIQDGEAANRTI
jgi:hypothetical protein